MNRHQLSLVLLACLSGACATPPLTATDVLVTRINREQPASENCPVGEVHYCIVDQDRSKHCQCTRERVLDEGSRR
jgi:hypothetical protein